MTPVNALWIDNEIDFVESMKLSLNNECTIHHVTDFSAEVLKSINIDQLDMVLLDIIHNQKVALDPVQELRKHRADIPIVIVTAHANKEICIQALNMGINGLLEKPVQVDSLKEMIARHRSRFGQLKMDQDRKAIFSQNKWVDLTSTEYKIIEALLNAKRRLTRSELQSSVWPSSTISENNLDTHLTNLKRKIPELSTCLNVKRGLGYYLESKKL